VLRSLAFLVLAGLALAGCGGRDKAGGTPASGTVTIEVAMRDGSPRLLTAYAEAVARIAKVPTEVESRIDWRSQDLNPEAATIADVREGRLDFALVSARALDTLGVRSFAPMLAPLAIDSLEAQRNVLESDVPERALAELAQLDVVGVAALPGDLRHLLGITRPLLRPEDLAGALIGVRASELAKRTFEQLGATATYAIGDNLSGFDGVEIDLVAMNNIRADVGAASLTADLTLWPRMLVLVANRDAWEQLDPARRAALRAGAHAALPAAIAKLRADDDESYDVVCRRGRISFARATPADAEALREALGPVVRGLDEQAVEEISRLRAAAGPPPMHPPCRPPRRSGDATRPPTAVDGVWTFDSDADDLRAADAPEDGITPENYGHHVLAFARGRFAITQEDREACTWVYGTYRVRGQRVTWNVVDGGGHGPQNAVNKPGEQFEYDWSRFRDTLRLAAVPGAVSAYNFNVKPWRRIGEDPRDAPFSRRCPPPPAGLQF
jgi:TRAP-type C4-dicarboxylate transport system substrate-binding protein